MKTNYIYIGIIVAVIAVVIFFLTKKSGFEGESGSKDDNKKDYDSKTSKSGKDIFPLKKGSGCVLSKNYCKGDDREIAAYVLKLQKVLNKKSFTPMSLISEDGDFGNSTQSRLKSLYGITEIGGQEFTNIINTGNLEGLHDFSWNI